MTDKEMNRYPNNEAYISKNNNSNRYTNLPNNSSDESMRASVLAQRVHDLQEQLISIATALNEDGKENRVWQQQLVKQHTQVTQILQKRQKEIQNLKIQLQRREEEKKQLKNTLFQQNQQFQNLHKQLQDARTSNSRINGRQLEEKVLQLNDQISTLLVKIQQLIEENNQHISYIQELQRGINQFKAYQEVYQLNLQRMTDQNNYLKEEIKEVQNMNIYQQTEIQNKYIEQLEEAKIQIQTLRKSQVQTNKADVSSQKLTHKQNGQLENQSNKLRGQIHSLEEQFLQHRQIQRSIKKKYEEKLNIAETQIQKLSQQITKLKHTNRKLQNQCAENSFALQQLQKQKKDSKKMQLFENQENYKNIILRLEAQKEQMNLKLAKAQMQIKYQQPTQIYTSLLREAELKIQRLKQELDISQVEVIKSKNAVKQYTQLAKRWEQDYRILAKLYEQGLALDRHNQERVRIEQIQFEKQRQRYWQTVRKCKMTQQLYKEIEQKLRIYQQSQTKSSSYYDKESSDLIKLQNSTLKQQISHLKFEITEINQQRSSMLPQNTPRDLFMTNKQTEYYKQREHELQRQLNILKIRLNSQLNNSKETDLIKIRELNDQLTRVNKMLNQRQMELDSFKEKYTEMQSYLNKKQQFVTINKNHPQYTRLKNQFVMLQRKLMETQLYYKNNIQNANYEIESLKVQNVHHRKKIEQLVLQLSKERSSLDYGKIIHSLQLSQLKIKQLQKQLQFSQLRINQLNQQLRKSLSRSRKNSQQLQKQINSSKNSQNLNKNVQKSYEINIDNHQNINQPSNNINPKIEQYNSSSYQQILKWKQEIKQSRTTFSKKWTNQFNKEHVENPHLWHPLKHQISS